MTKPHDKLDHTLKTCYEDTSTWFCLKYDVALFRHPCTSTGSANEPLLLNNGLLLVPVLNECTVQQYFDV